MRKQKLWMKVDSDLFKIIVMISHTGTSNNGVSHYFVVVA